MHLRHLRSHALAAAAMLLLLLPACATRYVGQRGGRDQSLLVIHLDLSRSPSYWRKVPLLCEPRSGERVWWNMHTDGDGLYYQEGVPVGRCWITGGFQDGIVTRIYKLPETAGLNPTTLSFAGPGVHFMGSFRYQPTDDDFQLVRTSAVGRSEALRRVLPWTEGTDWNGMVRRAVDGGR